MTSRIKILDCTFRDGGYYNDWDFDLDLAQEYFRVIGGSGVDVVELGFRLPAQERFLGAFAYCTDDFLSDLSLPTACRVAVMVNAADMLHHPGGAVVKALFDKRENSPISLVRIALHFRDLALVREIAIELKKLGYEVAVNLMQSAGKSDGELTQAAHTLDQSGAVDVLYFADSLGAMTPTEVRGACNALRAGWKGALGFHAHDNKGLALVNTLEARRNGATWLDGTLLGMGRGAGNARTEHLLLELQKEGVATGNAEALFGLAMRHFDGLQRKYGWGANMAYYLAATKNIHPTYIQEMLNSLAYSPEEVLQGIHRLGDATSFSRERLHQSMLADQEAMEGSWSAKGWIQGRDVLLVANGAGSRAHARALSLFIRRHKPFVVTLNLPSPNMPLISQIDACAICHPTRLKTLAVWPKGFEKTVITPRALSAEEALEGAGPVLDYGVETEAGVFKVRDNGCTIPSMLVAAYAIAACTAGGAGKIYLAGFDGYERGDPRQEEMASMISCYQAMSGARPLIALTPTLYPVHHSSVYSPTP